MFCTQLIESYELGTTALFNAIILSYLSYFTRKLPYSSLQKLDKGFKSAKFRVNY